MGTSDFKISRCVCGAWRHANKPCITCLNLTKHYTQQAASAASTARQSAPKGELLPKRFNQGLLMLVDMLITIMLYSQKPSIEQPLPVDKRIERYVSRSYDRTNANCALLIAYKESRFNQFALSRDKRYWGVFQLGHTQSDNWTMRRQLRLVNKYIQHRYTNWCNAWIHHQRHNWY